MCFLLFQHCTEWYNWRAGRNNAEDELLWVIGGVGAAVSTASLTCSVLA
jgi:hypothetical protein